MRQRDQPRLAEVESLQIYTISKWYRMHLCGRLMDAFADHKRSIYKRNKIAMNVKVSCIYDRESTEEFAKVNKNVGNPGFTKGSICGNKSEFMDSFLLLRYFLSLLLLLSPFTLCFSFLLALLALSLSVSSSSSFLSLSLFRPSSPLR